MSFEILNRSQVLMAPSTAVDLLVYNLTALSATVNTVDITNYELSGFQIIGDLSITESLTANDTYILFLTAENVSFNVLTASDVSFTDLYVINNTVLGANSTKSLVVNAGSVTFPSASSQANALVLGSDTNLYRSVADVLKTDDSFEIGPTGKTALRLPNTGTDTGLTIGGDVTLYRSTNDLLKTDDNFEIGVAGGKTSLRLTSTGADTGLTIGNDTNLYRASSGVLKTDHTLTVTTNLSVQGNTILGDGTEDEFTVNAGVIKFPNSSSTFPITLGTDVNLYRSTNNVLKTDDSLEVGTNLTVTGATTINGDTVIGNATSDLFTVNAGTVRFPSASAAGFALVLGSDANLYRSTTDVLKTDDSFVVAGALTVEGNTTLGNANTDTTLIRGGLDIGDGTSTKIRFGENNTTFDTTLYRSAADTLKTDDSLIVDGSLTVNLGGTITGNITVNANNSNTTGINSGTSTGVLTLGNNTALAETRLFGATTNINGLAINIGTANTTALNIGTLANLNTTIGNSTGDLTLNGDNITAPNQVVNADSSVLTRTSGDTRYGNIVDVTTTTNADFNTTTLTNTTLAITLPSTGFYELTLNASVSAAAADSAININLLGGGGLATNAINLISTYGRVDTATAPTRIQYTTLTNNNTVTPAAAGAITNYTYVGGINATTAGTITVQLATVTNARPLRLLAGSYIVARKLA